MSNSTFKVIVVGAGPVGLYLAHALDRAGIDFVVLEQQSSVVHEQGAGQVLYSQSTRLLTQIGLLDKYAEYFAVTRELEKTLQNGKLLASYPAFSIIEKNHGYPVLTVARARFVQALYEHLPGREERVKTSARVVHIETYDEGVRVFMRDGRVMEGSIVIGADGVHSATREAMQRMAKADGNDIAKDDKGMIASFHGIHGTAPIDGLNIKKGVFYETHGTGMLTQTVCDNEVVHFTALKRLKTPYVGRKKHTDEELEEMVKTFADVQIIPSMKFRDLWPRRTRATFVNQQEGLATTWHYGRIVLVSDSVHKITQASGLGVNSGLRSAASLANELHSLVQQQAETPNTKSIEEAFKRYQTLRNSEAHMIVAHGKGWIRHLTWDTWGSWFWDRYVMPWQSVKALEKDLWDNLSVPLISRGIVLEYVPFESKQGRVPWNEPIRARL